MLTAVSTSDGLCVLGGHVLIAPWHLLRSGKQKGLSPAAHIVLTQQLIEWSGYFTFHLAVLIAVEIVYTQWEKEKMEIKKPPRIIKYQAAFNQGGIKHFQS